MAAPVIVAVHVHVNATVIVIGPGTEGIHSGLADDQQSFVALSVSGRDARRLPALGNLENRAPGSSRAWPFVGLGMLHARNIYRPNQSISHDFL